MAHLERTKQTKPNSYAHELLVEHLAAMVKHPRVQADLANRAAYAADAAKATPLREPRTAKNMPQTSSKRSGGKPNTS